MAGALILRSVASSRAEWRNLERMLLIVESTQCSLTVVCGPTVVCDLSYGACFGTRTTPSSSACLKVLRGVPP